MRASQSLWQAPNNRLHRHHSYIYHAFSEIEFTFNYCSNLTTERLTNDRIPGISYRYDCAKKALHKTAKCFKKQSTGWL